MSAFEELRKGYSEAKKEEANTELTQEEKQLLEAKEETLTARARMRLAYLKSKGAGTNE